MGGAGGHFGTRQQGLQEGDVGGGAVDAELRQGAPRAGGQRREIAARRVDDHLREKRVEPRIGAVSRIAVAIDAHAGARRRVVGGQHAAGGAGVAAGSHGFEVDARLEGATGGRRGRGVEPEFGKGAPRRDVELQAHQIEAPRRLGHRVLDLKPRVRLDKRRPPILVDEEFDGAESPIAHRLAKADGGVREGAARGVGKRRVGRELDQFLMAALHAARALADMDDAA